MTHQGEEPRLGLVLDLRPLGAPPFGQLLDDAHVAGEPACRITYTRHGDRHFAIRAIRVDHPALEPPLPRGTGPERSDSRTEFIQVVRVNVLAEAMAIYLGSRAAEQSLERRVYFQHGPFLHQQDHSDGAVLEDGLEPLLAAP